ncbi:MAG: hypothetical protein HY352_05810 [Candidatus Omnitrophica bacterium]|nr:hypothetical protein [Candidatus Omnitrophota bacterium]
MILVHAVLLLSWWPLLPFFLDSYYHLNVIQAFRDAGGVVLHDFWEFAPLGRPHLYPPALHLLVLSLDWCHLPPVTLARLLTVVTYPVLLLATWWFMRTWWGSVPAYWATLCSVLPFSYLLVSCNTVAASWAIVAWLVGLVALFHRARLAFVLCGALVFYTHLGMPWVMVCSWMLVGLWYAPMRGFLLRAAAWTFALASPWLWHLWRHHASLGPMSSLENTQLELPILLYLFALVGLGMVLKERSTTAGRLLLSLWASLWLMVIHYRFRFFSGQGILGISLLAGLGLTRIHAWMEGVWRGRVRVAAWVIPAMLTCLAIAVNSTVFLQEGRRFVVVGDSSLLDLTLRSEHVTRGYGSSFYRPQFMSPIGQLIDQHSQADELIGCNFPYTCGLFAAVSHRAMATGMFAEVRAAQQQPLETLRHAHLIVWLKAASLPGMPSLTQLQREWSLRLIGETDMAFVFRNPLATTRRQVATPVLPLWLGFVFLWGAIGMVIVDLSWHREQRGRI